MGSVRDREALILIFLLYYFPRRVGCPVEVRLGFRVTFPRIDAVSCRGPMRPGTVPEARTNRTPSPISRTK